MIIQWSIENQLQRVTIQAISLKVLPMLYNLYRWLKRISEIQERIYNKRTYLDFELAKSYIGIESN